MLKFLSTFFLCLCLSFTTLAQDQTKKYTDAKAGFALEFPANWTTLPNYMGTHVLSLSPLEGKEDLYRENISVVAETLPGPVIARNYFQMYSDIMTRSLKQFKVIDTTDVTLAGAPAVKLVATYEGAGSPLTTEEYFVTQGNKGFVITTTALTAVYEKYRPGFEKIVLSLKFEQ